MLTCLTGQGIGSISPAHMEEKCFLLGVVTRVNKGLKWFPQTFLQTNQQTSRHFTLDSSTHTHSQEKPTTLFGHRIKDVENLGAGLTPPKPEIQNPKIQDPEIKIQNPKSDVQNPKFMKIPDPKSARTGRCTRACLSGGTSNR